MLFAVETQQMFDTSQQIDTLCSIVVTDPQCQTETMTVWWQHVLETSNLVTTALNVAPSSKCAETGMFIYGKMGKIFTHSASL